MAASAHLSAAPDFAAEFYELSGSADHGRWCLRSADMNAGVHLFTWAHPCSLLCERSALAPFPPVGHQVPLGGRESCPQGCTAWLLLPCLYFNDLWVSEDIRTASLETAC